MHLLRAPSTPRLRLVPTRRSASQAAWMVGSVTLLVLGCGPTEPEDPGAATPAEPAPVAHEEIVHEALSAPDRPTADRDDDESRKPAAVLLALGVEPGMTVIDLFAGGGYYTELLSHAVGPEGRVLAHTNQAYQGFVGEALSSRLERLTNVDLLEVEANDLELDPESIDAALLALTYHDFYWKPEDQDWDIDGSRLLAELREALKPGGALVLVDHAAADGAPTEEVVGTLHRIDESVVRADLEAAGFELVSSSDALRNPDDDRTLSVFDDQIRRKTDRFLHVYRKAAP